LKYHHQVPINSRKRLSTSDFIQSINIFIINNNQNVSTLVTINQNMTTPSIRNNHQNVIQSKCGHTSIRHNHQNVFTPTSDNQNVVTLPSDNQNVATPPSDIIIKLWPHLRVKIVSQCPGDYNSGHAHSAVAYSPRVLRVWHTTKPKGKKRTLEEKYPIEN
jgi:hypothetical protein